MRQTNFTCIHSSEPIHLDYNFNTDLKPFLSDNILEHIVKVILATSYCHKSLSTNVKCYIRTILYIFKEQLEFMSTP